MAATALSAEGAVPFAAAGVVLAPAAALAGAGCTMAAHTSCRLGSCAAEAAAGATAGRAAAADATAGVTAAWACAGCGGCCITGSGRASPNTAAGARVLAGTVNTLCTAFPAVPLTTLPDVLISTLASPVLGWGRAPFAGFKAAAPVADAREPMLLVVLSSMGGAGLCGC